MTITQPGAVQLEAPTLEEAPNVQLRARIDQLGLAGALRETTHAHRAALAAHLADPAAAASRAAYVGWLRRQIAAWAQVPLPTVHVASLEWPLASVRPQCLDVVGLLVADLRELSPGSRPPLLPRQATSYEGVRPGLVIAAAHTCLSAARLAADLLAPARTLTAGMTRVGPATRFLERCAGLAERADGFERDVERWGHQTSASESELAVRNTAAHLRRLVEVLDAGRHPGW
jgi:hypothetical protein